MKVKRFYGENVPSTLSKVKAEWGSDAVIIQSRKCRRAGPLSIFKPPVVEIVAAVDNDHQGRFRPPMTPDRTVLPDRTMIPDRTITQATTPEKTLYDEITELRKIIEDKIAFVPQSKVYPGHFEQFFQILLDNDVDEEIASDIVDRALHQIDQSLWQDMAALKNGLIKIISEYFHIDHQDPFAGKNRIALIGPTGVGKTTTIAKLAAITSVLKEKKVAMITIDTFRVGAVDQLKTYADIISISLDVAHTPKELRDLLIRHSDKDLVLIDTAGRSPYNKLQIAEIKGFLDACPDVKIYLVLSVATNHKDLNEIISRFGRFDIDKLIFTKLDETKRYGSVINVANSFKKDLAYVTTGQNVPDDIEVPISTDVARLILHENQVERPVLADSYPL